MDTELGPRGRPAAAGVRPHRPGRGARRATASGSAPGGRADIMDMALAGRTATVEAIEQDFEGRVYLAVTVDDDPGKDLGLLRQPGHRFFFRPEEVEPLTVRRPHDGALPARPGQSRFTVQAFAAGLLSFLGHSPTFAVRDFCRRRCASRRGDRRAWSST